MIVVYFFGTPCLPDSGLCGYDLLVN